MMGRIATKLIKAEIRFWWRLGAILHNFFVNDFIRMIHKSLALIYEH